MELILGDCKTKLKELEDNSIDAIITDPPYELGFMGKDWDDTGIANDPEMWGECLRVLKPGGYLLAFSGTRTYHRMASAIEDAGFEIRDMIEWVYGSGFPKSLNIGKTVDRLKGKEPIVVGKRTDGRYGSKFQDGNNQFVNAENNQRKEVDSKIGLITKPATPEGEQWEGWGTNLKPAHEPICMARKPLSEKSVAENCLKWGVGGINIDESRVDGKPRKTGTKPTSDEATGSGNTLQGSSKNRQAEYDEQNQGRFPANLIHDGSEEVRECFPQTKSGGGDKRTINGGSMFLGKGAGKSLPYKDFKIDSGNASRFFKSIIYTAKASKSERNMGCEELETSEKFTAGNYSQSPTCKDCGLTLNGTNDHSKCSGEVYYKEMESKNTKNNHPTVKPIALMEYLINMVSREGQVILDPFMGSGTTGMACKKLDREFIGIEMIPEYMEIAEARIEATKKDEQLGLI